MRVGVGYSENPDTVQAGIEAATEALKNAGQTAPCDFVLLFSTASHDAHTLRDAILPIVGSTTKIVGGGASGAISNTRYGYAGDQIILAAFWLDSSRCDILVEGGLTAGEEQVGERLGRRLASCGTEPDSSVLLFYDAIDRTQGHVRLLMATHLLSGIEKGLGFLPDLAGAGLQGDYICSPTRQWTGTEVAEHTALALKFSGSVKMHRTIMHGCRPSTGYYTVTRAEGQSILEINHQPALQFLDALLGSAIPPESYPFFLIFGINKGEKWGEFDENSYVNHLCLAIDRDRDAIVMFEPDMVAGTEFQIMYRNLDLDYIAPRIEQIFNELEDREPIFALYIDCAGRAAGYGGIELEDAVAVQNAVCGRVPLMGIYTGVEIAPVEGRPRGLDWTGVFCLFSVPK